MKKLYLLILVLVFISCTKEEEQVIETDSIITVGTFNVEWLGDGYNDRNDRTEADYKNIATIIRKTGADVLSLQEIENSAAIRRILEHLPEYDFIIGTGGGSQNLAIIFKKKITCKFDEEYFPLAVIKKGTRPGLVANVKKGNFDFYFMAVHLKSSSHWEKTEEKQDRSREIRTKQSAIISEWINSKLESSDEKDLIVAGDFNDTPVRKKNNTMYPITGNQNIAFITAEMKSCKYRSSYGIDHIIASREAEKRYVKDSERAYNFRSSLADDASKRVSDHCPVLLQFDISEADND